MKGGCSVITGSSGGRLPGVDSIQEKLIQTPAPGASCCGTNPQHPIKKNGAHLYPALQHVSKKLLKV